MLTVIIVGTAPEDSRTESLPLSTLASVPPQFRPRRRGEQAPRGVDHDSLHLPHSRPRVSRDDDAQRAGQDETHVREPHHHCIEQLDTSSARRALEYGCQECREDCADIPHSSPQVRSLLSSPERELTDRVQDRTRQRVRRTCD